MTASDLRALGWVVTRDAFWEIVRSLAGRTPRLPITTMRKLGEQWRKLQDVAAKSSNPRFAGSVLSPLLQPMSAETCAAAVEYLTLMSTSCPELYSPPAMRERCRRACVRAIAGLAGSILLSILGSPTVPLMADAILVLLAMGAWNLTTFLQLHCVHKLISRHGSRHRFSDLQRRR